MFMVYIHNMQGGFEYVQHRFNSCNRVGIATSFRSLANTTVLIWRKAASGGTMSTGTRAVFTMSRALLPIKICPGG